MFKQKKKSKIISKEEMVKFKDLLEQEQGMRDIIKASQALWVGLRTQLNKKLEKFWDELIKKYKLEKEKGFSLDKETGELTEIENPPIPKEVKKNG